MSYFGDYSVEQSILDDVIWQKEENNLSNYQIIIALVKVIGYFAEHEDEQ